MIEHDFQGKKIMGAEASRLSMSKNRNYTSIEKEV
jgi:hypothetical protein